MQQQQRVMSLRLQMKILSEKDKDRAVDVSVGVVIDASNFSRSPHAAATDGCHLTHCSPSSSSSSAAAVELSTTRASKRLKTEATAAPAKNIIKVLRGNQSKQEPEDVFSLSIAQQDPADHDDDDHNLLLHKDIINGRAVSTTRGGRGRTKLVESSTATGMDTTGIDDEKGPSSKLRRVGSRLKLKGRDNAAATASDVHYIGDSPLRTSTSTPMDPEAGRERDNAASSHRDDRLGDRYDAKRIGSRDTATSCSTWDVFQPNAKQSRDDSMHYLVTSNHTTASAIPTARIARKESSALQLASKRHEDFASGDTHRHDDHDPSPLTR